MRSNSWLPALTLACIAASPAALAEPAGHRPMGVVELFTSQGCSSCPPADSNFADIARSGKVIALAYHVDYWDYLGWKDTFATKGSTERQYAYAAAFGSSAYTPQVVINGRRDVVGSHDTAVHRALTTMAGTQNGLTVDLSYTETADSVVVETGASSQSAGRDIRVILVNFVPRRVVKVERGENRGRSIEYWNAVTDIQAIGMWHGEASRYELPKSEIGGKSGGCAVLLQAFDEDGQPGAILGALMLRKP